MQIGVGFVLAALMGLHSGVQASPMVDELNVLARRQTAGYGSPPVYPAPKGGWTPDWAEAYGKAKKLVEQMTLAEKVNVTTAIGWMNGPCVGNTGTVNRLGFPSICAQDGPLGIRYADFITAFPAGITTGATWDKDLIYERAHAMGEEAKAKGVHLLLGPAIGALGRQPAAGRNWEGFGSDPYLQGIAGAQTVHGIQDAGTQACAKHFIANEQEHYRGDGGVPESINPEVDDRTMHEVYLWPFSDTVKAGVASVMCSYNQINGSYGCQNSKLLNGLLKDELGFQGYVVSDWLGQRSGVGSSLAGMDQSQPGDGARWADGRSFWGPELSRAVLNGSVPIDRLNDQVTRVVAAYYQLGQDVGFPKTSFSSWTKADTDVAYRGSNSGPRITVNTHLDVRSNHGTIAKNVARDGITLLKNEDNVLPLSANSVVRVFGTGAAPNPDGVNSCVDRGCNKGTLGMGWGSGTADYQSFSSPIDQIKARASNTQSVISDTVSSQMTQMASTSGAKCLVFVSSNGGEAFITVAGHQGDRNDINLWNNGDNLIQGIANACPNTIVIVHTVGPVNMEKWADLPNVKAILVAHLPGQEAGSSLAEVLFGDVSPSGHLPYTIGKSLSDYGSSVQIQKSPGSQRFTEGLYVDYKWFDKQAITPRYEFGYGLSYTTFSYSGLSVKTVKAPTEEPSSSKPARIPVPTYSTSTPNPNEVAWPSYITFKPNLFIYPYLDNPSSITKGSYPYPAGYSTTEKEPSKAGGAQGGHPDLWDTIYEVSVNVKNTGSRTGKAVPQLYLEFPQNSGYDTPIRQLRGFEKVELKAGEQKTVTFKLLRRDLSVWDVVKQQWVIPRAGAGGYTVHVGSSSRDLPVKCNVLSCDSTGSTTTSIPPTTTSTTSTTNTVTSVSTTSVVPTTTTSTTTPVTTTTPTTTSTTTRPSTTTTTTPVVTPTGCASSMWGQCGGIGYTGCTSCVSGAKCMNYNDHYSQCIPA